MQYIVNCKMMARKKQIVVIVIRSNCKKYTSVIFFLSVSELLEFSFILQRK